MIEQALLERGLLGVIVLALGLAVVKLYNELRQAQNKHREEVVALQVAFTETSRDAYEQMLLAHKDFTDRLLSIVTTTTETQERLTQSIAQMLASLNRIEVDIDEANRKNDKAND